MNDYEIIGDDIADEVLSDPRLGSENMGAHEYRETLRWIVDVLNGAISASERENP